MEEDQEDIGILETKRKCFKLERTLTMAQAARKSSIIKTEYQIYNIEVFSNLGKIRFNRVEG